MKAFAFVCRLPPMWGRGRGRTLEVRPIAIGEVSKRTMGNVLREQAHHIGDDVWMMFGDDHYTYSRANDLVNAYACGLQASGVHYGDVVALFMNDCPEYVFLNLALAKIGAVH